MPASGLHLPEHGQLVAELVLVQLMLDVVRYLNRIFACRVNIVATTPKLPIPVFELKRRIPFVDHQATLPLQESHESRNRIFRRYLEKHVYMIWTNFRLDDIHLFPVAKRT